MIYKSVATEYIKIKQPYLEDIQITTTDVASTKIQRAWTSRRGFVLHFLQSICCECVLCVMWFLSMCWSVQLKSKTQIVFQEANSISRVTFCLVKSNRLQITRNLYGIPDAVGTT